ncbi:MAG: hypothetical protein WDW36_003583 [Sanguina aurantia]
MANARVQVVQLEAQLFERCTAAQEAADRCSEVEASLARARESETSAVEAARQTLLQEAGLALRGAMAAKDAAAAAQEAAASHRVATAEAGLDSCQAMLREAQARATAAEDAKIELVMAMAAGGGSGIHRGGSGSGGADALLIGGGAKLRPPTHDPTPAHAPPGQSIGSLLHGSDGRGVEEQDGMGAIDGWDTGREVGRGAEGGAELATARVELFELSEQLEELRRRLRGGGVAGRQRWGWGVCKRGRGLRRCGDDHRRPSGAPGRRSQHTPCTDGHAGMWSQLEAVTARREVVPVPGDDHGLKVLRFRHGTHVG